MNNSTSPSDAGDALADVPESDRPKHIAIIMDGNGRWAKERGMPRIEGHRKGVASVRAVVEEASRFGLKQLTLYCFCLLYTSDAADE